MKQGPTTTCSPFPLAVLGARVRPSGAGTRQQVKAALRRRPRHDYGARTVSVAARPSSHAPRI
ncbi:MAG: hypothetical protein ACLSVD_12735 [Eggerthellaceae bacterium]